MIDRLDSWSFGTFSLSSSDDGLWKGALYVNGHHLGRYYLIVAQGQSGECAPCDYRGTYSYNKCSTGCGEPTQRYWHLPREWMVDGMNEVTIQEEKNNIKSLQDNPAENAAEILAVSSWRFVPLNISPVAK